MECTVRLLLSHTEQSSGAAKMVQVAVDPVVERLAVATATASQWNARNGERMLWSYPGKRDESFTRTHVHCPRRPSRMPGRTSRYHDAAF